MIKKYRDVENEIANYYDANDEHEIEAYQRSLSTYDDHLEEISDKSKGE